MNDERDSDYRGVWWVRVRRDGTILLPEDLNWKHGETLELRGYGFKDSFYLTHIINMHDKAMDTAEKERKADELKKHLSLENYDA